MEEDPKRSQAPVLGTCSNCHDAAGMHSFISYSRERFGPNDVTPPKLIDSTPSRESATQIQWIKQHGKLTFADSVANRVK
jgi:IS4 transposase